MIGDIRVGLVGVGFIGSVHARSAVLAGGRLVAVAASTPASARAAAEKFGVDRAFASAEELVAAADIDVVHICTPNHLHAPLAVAALRAGKHVICEKPIALNPTEGRELAQAAADAERLFAVPFVYRYYPMVREARERVRSGTTGPVTLMHGSYLQDWLLGRDDHNWRVDRQLGGASRAFADVGSHWCDLAQFVSGHRIRRLSARTHIVVPQRRGAASRAAFSPSDGSGELSSVSTEDAVTVQFETDRGALGSLIVSQVSPGRKNRLWIEFDCAREAVVFNQEKPEMLWCGRRGSATVLQRDPNELSESARALSVLPAGHPQGYASSFEAFVSDAYAAIHAGGQSDELPTVSDGLAAVDLTGAVLESAATGDWVDVPATGAPLGRTDADSLARADPAPVMGE